MKSWNIIGIRRMDIDKGDDSYHGFKLYFSREDENVQGVECCAYTLKDGKCDYVPVIGDEVYLFLNPYGKLDGVLPVY